MGIQSSINSLLSQAQRLATFYVGFDKAKQIVGDTTTTKNEAKIQTDIAAGNAPMKDGKVDPEWLQKRREKYTLDNSFFSSTGELTARGAMKAQRLSSDMAKGERIGYGDIKFMEDKRVQEYLKSTAANSLLRNKVASDLARGSVEARTASINKAKSNFDEHTASLIKYYSKGSGNP